MISPEEALLADPKMTDHDTAAHGITFCGSCAILGVRLALSAELDRLREASLDVERARQTFHNEYEGTEKGCRHQNQHKASWDCQRRVNEFAAEYAALDRLRLQAVERAARIVVDTETLEDGEFTLRLAALRAALGDRTVEESGPYTYTLWDKDTGNVVAGGTLQEVLQQAYGLGQANPDTDIGLLVILEPDREAPAFWPLPCPVCRQRVAAEEGR